MTDIDQFKAWLEIYLLDLDKDFDTDVYLDYLFEMMTSFCPNPSNEKEIIENLHSTLESLLPDIQKNKSVEILDKYVAEVLNKEHNNISELDETNFLSEIIKKDKNAIDKKKRENLLDPRYALYYKPGDVCESDDSSYSDGDIDAEFSAVRIQSTNKIDDVLAVFDSEKLTKTTGNKEKVSTLAAMKNHSKKNYESDEDDSNDPDYDPIFDESGRSNREAVDKAAQELRVKMKEKHLQKKEKDKIDRAKQKEQTKARKENEKKRTQKSERRR